VATVMRTYPTYRLEDFYRKSFIQGGLTLDQVVFLFESYDSSRYDDQRFMAAIHGIDMDAAEEDGVKPTAQQPVSKALPKSTTNVEKPFLFRDPADYANMSEDERAAETRKMMGFWKPFAQGAMESASPKLHES